MMLSELLTDRSVPRDVLITGICDDSRNVQAGSVFCAVKGDVHDGRDYIGVAIEKGASAILCDTPLAEHLQSEIPEAIPVIEIDDLRNQLGALADEFYGHPSDGMRVVAVTGTNGKTSFTHLLAQALSVRGKPAGLIGTMGHGTPGDLSEAGLTTPPAIDLQRRLDSLLRAGCSAAVIEASSHGLVQGRLNGTRVTTAVLTNITHDHLDYHESFEAYRDAKRRLFTLEGVRNAVVNLDDDSADDLIAGMPGHLNLVRFSLADSRDSLGTEVCCLERTYLANGMSIVVAIPGGEIKAHLPLFGEFNIQNVLAVIATLVAEGWQQQDIESALASLTPVAGRMDVIQRAGKPTIVIDYAHTPDALEKCLQAIRQHFAERRIWCVFGCGGDRDSAKRPMMGRIASRYADALVLTSDNPRSENPESILEDIMAGVESDEHQDVRMLTDRREAIHQAISAAEAGDVVLVAGKGHEDYQELAGGRIAFSDYAVVETALGEET